MRTPWRIRSAQSELEELGDQQNYLENYSRRNNVKIFGIPEKEDGKETWDESEMKAIEAIRSSLKISEKLSVDRAHRVGKPRPQFRHIGGSKVRSQPRPIVVRFHHWEVKEKVVKAAREIKPDGLKFYEDFSQRTLQRRKELIPELIKY